MYSKDMSLWYECIQFNANNDFGKMNMFLAPNGFLDQCGDGFLLYELPHDSCFDDLDELMTAGQAEYLYCNEDFR